MSYYRVIPRDLFNEANLLKCYAQIYLNLEMLNAIHVSLEHDGAAFEIDQCEDDGSLTIVNVSLEVRGVAYPLRRPLNSRDAWPLYVTVDDIDIPVFGNGDAGHFSEDMMDFLRR